jgi:ribosomal protein S18 acetylase RimI-like enzyme
VVIEVRPVQLPDVSAAEEAWHAAYATMRAAHHLPPEPRTIESAEMGRRRIAHLLVTDPDGSWLAEDAGRVVGMAQSQIRGKRWTLSNLGVHPEYQERGLGHQLLGEALRYGASCSAGAIFCSPDPRAVHRYVRAGFALHPAVAAFGPVRKSVERPGSVREAGVESLDHVDEIDSAVRGDNRRRDWKFQLSIGFRLLIDPDGGYALVRDGRVGALAALNETIAARLLRAHLARCDGGQVIGVSWMRAKDQWAIEALAEGAVELHVRGAVMLRGDWEMNGVYLPHGVFG